MWQIINEIRRQGNMSGYAVSQFSRFTLHRKKKSAGGCLRHALAQGHIQIVGVTVVNGVQYNIYA